MAVWPGRTPIPIIYEAEAGATADPKFVNFSIYFSPLLLINRPSTGDYLDTFFTKCAYRLIKTGPNDRFSPKS